MDIPGWIRLTVLTGASAWINTRHIVGVLPDNERPATIVRDVTDMDPEGGWRVSETVDEVMRLIDAANPP